jgi:hypothetical protein
MFNAKYTSIFANGRYLVNLGKRWEVWQNTKKRLVEIIVVVDDIK